MKRAAKLRLLSTQAREKLAAELLNPDKVLAQAAAAASQGAAFIRLTLDTPALLKTTEAARAFEAKLAGEGFKVTWETRLLPAKANLTGADVTICEPVIRWED